MEYREGYQGAVIRSFSLIPSFIALLWFTVTTMGPTFDAAMTG
jgi:hypothetical protein